MDDAQFWDIIDATGKAARYDPERQVAALRKRLTRLTSDELTAFHAHFNRKMAVAYFVDLWGAAYLINGGCSDDGFAYFRAWLLSGGRAVYEAALRDPDSLAAVTDPDRDDYDFEEIWGVARDVYEEKTGQEMPYVELSETPEPQGEPWDFEDDAEIAKRLPKLARQRDVLQ